MKKLLGLTLLMIQVSISQISYNGLNAAQFSGNNNFQRQNILQQKALKNIKYYEPAHRTEKKKVGLAVLYSLLLPGMGELYSGNYSKGKYFTIAEGALWLTYGSFQWYGSWVQNDARRFAVQHAQVSLENKNDQYFVDIGNFQNVYSYNEEILRQRDDHKVYDPLSSFYWSWDTRSNQEQYRELRVSSDNVFNNARFVLAAIAVNHLVSAFNAARTASSYNEGVPETSYLDIRANIVGGISNPDGIVISFSKTF